MTEKTDYEKGRGMAMGFGALVYVGVVFAASTLFITFVLKAFPEDAYFSRFVMGVAGFIVGLSMLAFPVALHKWTVERTHRLITTVLYYVEMAIIAVNTIVAFMTLLSLYTDFTVPDWAIAYEPLSIASIVYTLGAWGTVFLTDPMHKATSQANAAQQKFYEKVAQKEVEFLDSIEGEDAIIAAAMAKINKTYDASKFSTEKRHFGGGATKKDAPIEVKADKPFEVKAAETEGPHTVKSFRRGKSV